MRYQFTLGPRPDGPSRALLWLAWLPFGLTLVATVTALACGDKTPQPADAKEERVTVEPAADVSTPGATIVGPVSFERAESAYKARQFDEAVTLFKAYSLDRPENVWGYYMLGLSAWKAGGHAEAESAFVRALELDSTHVKSHVNLSRVLLETNRPNEALPHLEIVRGLDPTSSEPLRLLGRAYGLLGRTDDAIASIEEAIVLNGRDVWALNNLGVIFIRQERFGEALGPLARAVEIASEVATFRNNLGLALERTGHYAAAAEQYRAAVGIDSTYAKAAANLARVEGLTDDPSLPPVDLGEVVRRFLEQVETWRQEPGGDGW